MKWQIRSPQSLHMHSWDEETLVYDAMSGHTHLLGALAALVFDALDEAPAGADRLAAALHASLLQHLPDTPAADYPAHLESVLAELAGIDLIAPAAS